jgi:hypothetical protein
MGTVTLTAPTNGFALVIHTGYAEFSGGGTLITIGTGTDPSTITDGIVMGHQGSIVGSFSLPYTTTSIATVNRDETSTFNALVELDLDFPDNSVTVFPQNLIAVFIGIDKLY